MRPSHAARCVLALVGLAGCARLGGSADSYRGVFEGARPAVATRDVLAVRWTRGLTGELDRPAVPVESAAAGLDPQRDRVFVGSAAGLFYAFDVRGRELATYDPAAGIDAAPAIAQETGDVFLACDDGSVHALALSGATTARRGLGEGLRESGEPPSLERSWRAETGGTVRRQPVLAEDAVYVVTEQDRVVAFSRESGEELWRYERPWDGEFAISGHAGLTLHEGVLFTGMTDGTVVALDAASGAPVWERPTAVDVSPDAAAAVTFFDVDTTPVVVDDAVYVAGFSAGFYVLERSSGSVRYRDGQLLGVVELAAADDWVLLSSAERGLVALRPSEEHTVAWERPAGRGAVGRPVVLPRRGLVLAGETRGALRALDLRSGRELASLSSGTGFSAPLALEGRLGWALSNGGRLFAFRL